MSAANELAREAEGRIGTTLLGKWRVLRLIGIGGMGAVYEAQHRNESRVAVKVLHRSAGLSQAQVARFKREGYAANRVGHSGVVEVFDDNVDEHGSAFLVMELLTGQTAAELAKEHGGKLPFERVLDLGEQVLDILAAAHAKGILHRDIKPENLFITTEGKLKLLDFGIARLSDAEPGGPRTIDGTLLGTPAFAPPEQARGRVGEMDERSDVWAVGATLFTLLAGRPVHRAETTNEQLGLAMSVSAPSLGRLEPELPPAVVALVDRALAYEKCDRWPSALAMQEAVREARGAIASVPRPGSGWRGKRQRAFLAAAAVAAIGIAAPIAASLRSTKRATAATRPDIQMSTAAPNPSTSLATVAVNAPADPAPVTRMIDTRSRTTTARRQAIPRASSASSPAPPAPLAPIAGPAPVESAHPPAGRGLFDRRH